MGRGLYHICFTSHNEVLCRSYKDYCMMFNCIAQAVFKTGSSLLAHAIMSTHVHMIAVCADPSNLVMRIRTSYTQMFNHRYKRKGALGDKAFFCSKLEGRRHIAAAISYVIRNPYHHEVCANLYSYPFSSVNQYFKNKIQSFSPVTEAVFRRKKSDIIRIKNHLPDDVDVLRSTGMISYDDVVDSVLVEGYFGSYRAFLFGLNRNDYERWMREQEEDDDGLPPVTLGTVEAFLPDREVQLILKQNQHWVNEKRVSDIELCDIIDHQCVPRYGKVSYVQLSHSEVDDVRQSLADALRVSQGQLERCLPYS